MTLLAMLACMHLTEAKCPLISPLQDSLTVTARLSRLPYAAHQLGHPCKQDKCDNIAYAGACTSYGRLSLCATCEQHITLAACPSDLTQSFSVTYLRKVARQHCTPTHHSTPTLEHAHSFSSCNNEYACTQPPTLNADLGTCSEPYWG